MPRRVAIVGGGVAGLGVAWAPNRHPDRLEFRLFEAEAHLGGNAMTVHCGAHTLVNSQETCFVSGLVTARQLGADYPFGDDEARKWFNFCGRVTDGASGRRAGPSGASGIARFAGAPASQPLGFALRSREFPPFTAPRTS